MSAPVIPPGKTWLDTLNKSFVDVHVDAANDNAVSTSDFLEAAESFTTLFDVIGVLAFNTVKSDLVGNIKKIRERQLAAPAESETLQALVINELKTKKHTATEGLLWLVRGLQFTGEAIRDSLDAPDKELADSFRTAYGSTLKPHHSFLVKPVFTAALSATPYRKDFFSKLGFDAGAEPALKEYVAALQNQVKILQDFQSRKEAQWK
ncbi:glycolipid transfer protein HET-C2, putative [Talaromyces stipitatus ATCC 10500]|uniref:Glycolipid transfer protein HET-C2, putative n=1 Tax=Talaromyces stipitatus (strain ATCC 10500 / CBS 375.48 / QM 6759 / NRRL 1006) TaxID=441959 RepID=B8M4Y1_TALSN|nr:glycolipid transfer protein HET-C2, putative [Talaromyces stipitatus ATCC 10500]EED19416.1 glycolipid transfer protein HET-C2, putative [Talaromyces stipitatus ATCC 10500]